MADAGQPVNEGDVILEFDPADQQHALEQAESEVLEAEQEIIKRRADTEAAAAQDKVRCSTRSRTSVGPSSTRPWTRT